jgi:hypothetical protein
MTLFVSCLIGHVALAAVIPSPWWVPDLTLIGLVFAIIRAPERWLGWSVAAGIFSMAWAIRWPRALLIAYLGVGALLWWLAQRVDVSDARIQRLALIVASAGLSLTWLWMDEAWSWPLLGLVVVRTAVTLLAAMMVRALR